MDKATDDDQSGGRLLGALEDAALMQQYVAKIQNMRDVHKSILTELEHMVTEWVENCEVGRIFVRNSQQLEAAYPPFVNTFARLLAFIDACEKKYPRFQAHLKLCEKQREYGREHIKSILIRPVQRLGSILLLLKELSKQSLKANENDKRAAHQREVNPDIACLAEAAKEVDRYKLQKSLSIGNLSSHYSTTGHAQFYYKQSIVRLLPLKGYVALVLH